MISIYKINQKMINGLKFCFFIGLPLIVSFMLSALAPYRPLSVVLLLVAFFLNSRYPDRMALEQGLLRVKLFLVNDWLEYPLTQLEIRQEKGYLQLYLDGRKAYRISLENLSTRLYEELRTFITIEDV